MGGLFDIAGMIGVCVPVNSTAFYSFVMRITLFYEVTISNRYVHLIQFGTHVSDPDPVSVPAVGSSQQFT